MEKQYRIAEYNGYYIIQKHYKRNETIGYNIFLFEKKKEVEVWKNCDVNGQHILRTKVYFSLEKAKENIDRFISVVFPIIHE